MAPLLTTKLYVPSPHPNLVPRPHLIRRLDEGLDLGHRLTLISAPAGFGKTTLLSEWIHQGEMPVAWLSLDDSDNDPARFLAYLIAACRRIDETIRGKGALGALQSPQPPPIESILTTLINEILAVPGNFAIVLDDYHTITAQPVHDALAFLVDHLPPQMHLVIATRADPPVPLARLRGRGQLTELRQADLRFTPEEVAEFLNQVMKLSLSAEDVAAMVSRTEGWIAGLQMAAIALQAHVSTYGRGNAANFVQAFTGSNRYVLDYLVEEVLQHQPDSVQTFLLQTSILGRLSGTLCDAVVGIRESTNQRIGESANQRISKSASQQVREYASMQVGKPLSQRIGDLPICRFAHLPGQEMLEYLERANLFLVPLDNRREWYRYHHLFAHLLRQRLHQAHPDLVPILHGRASTWYEQHGFTAEAIDHALDAGDFEWAGSLIDEHVEILWGRGEQATLSRWLEALPDEVIGSRPQLCIYHAFTRFLAGQLDEAEQRLQAAERMLGRPDQPRDHSQAALQGMVAAVRAYIAFLQEDVPAIIQFSRQALDHLPKEKSMWRSVVAIVSGDAHSFRGDTVAAGQGYAEALAISKATGNTYSSLFASAKLATNKLLQGRLHQVADICQQGLQLAEENGVSQTARAGGLLALQAGVLCQWNDLDRALHCAQRAVDLCERENNVVLLGLSYLILTRVLLARRDWTGAEATMQKLEELAQESAVPSWLTSPAAAYQVRIWIAQGKQQAAARLLQTREMPPLALIAQGEAVDDNVIYMRQDECLSQVRLLIAQSNGHPSGPRLEVALTLLERLRHLVEARGLVPKVIELTALRALAHQAQGDVPQAMTALEQALSLAEPEGFVRVFVDEGEPMARLLRRAAAQGISSEYVGRLLDAFEFQASGSGATQANLKPGTPTRETPAEPLSERELEVLRLLRTHLPSTEIAEALVVSVNTARSHIKNIYSKLDVHSRADAVRRAEELGLL